MHISNFWQLCNNEQDLHDCRSTSALVATKRAEVFETERYCILTNTVLAQKNRYLGQKTTHQILNFGKTLYLQQLYPQQQQGGAEQSETKRKLNLYLMRLC